MPKPEQLAAPEGAMSDPKAREVIRAWIAHGELWCALRIGAWAEDGQIDEAEAWGLLLADVARHVANGLAQEFGRDQDEALKVIKDAMTVELAEPTTTLKGGFADDDSDR